MISVAAVLLRCDPVAQEVQFLFVKSAQLCASFLCREEVQKCCALVLILRDTLSDLLRTLYNQAMLNLVNPLFKLR